MRACTTDTDGREITTYFWLPVQPVFEVRSFFLRLPAEESIQALTYCSGWTVSYEKLNHLFHAIPQFREFGRMVLVKSFASFKSRTLSMITQTAEERYSDMLHHFPDIFQHAPLKQIATYLGVTDSSLSRIRKETMK